MIGILDYDLGNVRAIANIYKRLNIPARIASRPDDLEGVSRLILPGVGSFDWAMTCLNHSGMRQRVDALVLDHRCPVLGICVGMQMLAHQSEEGEQPGLSWIDADVKRLTNHSDQMPFRLPHMGWNDVSPVGAGELFRGLESNARFYFLHSYYVSPRHDAHVLAVTDYNGAFASSIGRDNIFGVQFHPEKSHSWGVRLLKNFAESHLC